MIDVGSYPWCPQWLDMLDVLRQRRGLPSLQFPAFKDRQMDLPVLPYMTAFEVGLPANAPMHEIEVLHVSTSHVPRVISQMCFDSGDCKLDPESTEYTPCLVFLLAAQDMLYPVTITSSVQGRAC